MDLAARFDKHPDIDHRTIGGEGFIITPGSSQIHSLNPTGAFILEQLDGRRTLAEVVESVTSEFDIDRAHAERDTLAFVLLMETKGIIRRVESR